MSLLLLRAEARLPFYIEKADIRLHSLQELCYVIYNYPLVFSEELINEELISWIRDELSMGILAERLSKLLETGEDAENMLYLILREGNYYSIGEITDFKLKLADIKKLNREERLLAAAASYFRLGRFAEACDCFFEAEKHLRERIKKNVTEDREKLFMRLSEIICDEAVCRLRLFDDKAARELLLEGAGMVQNSRCGEYLYLMDEKLGEKLVSDERKAELNAVKDEARDKALLSREYKSVAEIFEMDSVKREEETKKLVSKWKSVYRKMV